MRVKGLVRHMSVMESFVMYKMANSNLALTFQMCLSWAWSWSSSRRHLDAEHAMPPCVLAMVVKFMC